MLNMENEKDLLNILWDGNKRSWRKSFTLRSDSLKLLIYSDKQVILGLRRTLSHRTFTSSVHRKCIIEPGFNVICLCKRLSYFALPVYRQYSRNNHVKLDIFIFPNTHIYGYGNINREWDDPEFYTRTFMRREFSEMDYRIECFSISTRDQQRDWKEPVSLREMTIRDVIFRGYLPGQMTQLIGNLLRPDVFCLTPLQYMLLDCSYMKKMAFSHRGDYCYSLLGSRGHMTPIRGCDTITKTIIRPNFYDLCYLPEYRDFLLQYEEVIRQNDFFNFNERYFYIVARREDDSDEMREIDQDIDWFGA